MKTYGKGFPEKMGARRDSRTSGLARVKFEKGFTHQRGMQVRRYIKKQPTSLPRDEVGLKKEIRCWSISDLHYLPMG